MVIEDWIQDDLIMDYYGNRMINLCTTPNVERVMFQVLLLLMNECGSFIMLPFYILI